MWEVWYGLEAANYLADNGALVSSLFFAMESLAEHEGLPTTGDFQEVEEMIFWRVQHHLVIYERLVEKQVVQINVIKPA